MPLFLLLGLVQAKRLPTIEPLTGSVFSAFFYALGWSLLQALPLPRQLISFFSPARAELFHFGSAATISLNSRQTLDALPWLLSLTAVFLLFASAPAPVSLIAEKENRDNRPELRHLPLRESLALAATAAGAICALIAIIHWLFAAEHYFGVFAVSTQSRDTARAHFPFVNPDHLAAFLAMCLALVVGLPGFSSQRSLRPVARRPVASYSVASLIGAFLILLAVLLTQSRAGILLCLLSLGVLFQAGKIPRQFSLILGGALMLGLFSGAFQRLLTAGVETMRSDMLAVTWQIIWQFPLTGVGLGNWANAAYHFAPAQLASYRLDYAHNEPLQLLAELGIIGILPLLYVGWRLVSALWRTSASEEREWLVYAAVLLIPLLHSLVDFPLRNPAISALFAAVFGQLVATVSRREQRQLVC